MEAREAVELRPWPKRSRDDLLASKEARSSAKELLRDLVLVDCAPMECVLSMLALCPAQPGTATHSTYLIYPTRQ